MTIYEDRYSAVVTTTTTVKMDKNNHSDFNLNPIFTANHNSMAHSPTTINAKTSIVNETPFKRAYRSSQNNTNSGSMSRLTSVIRRSLRLGPKQTTTAGTFDNVPTRRMTFRRTFDDKEGFVYINKKLN
uniref:Uncharacterized protein n=1 Tax=Rhabditophanes sp. KR3021 TaxID=114890 RepID=A0AC35TPE7_9BILA